MSGISETRTVNALLTTTLANYRNVLVDQIFDFYPYLSWINGSLGRTMNVKRGEGSIKRFASGESIVEQLMYAVNTTAKPYAGAEVIDTTLQDNLTIARYNWKQYAATIGITGLDFRSNSGKEALLNLLKAKTTNAIMSLRNVMSEDAYGDGTGNGGKDLTGLEALVSATSTVGGLAPGTFDWWKSVVTGSVGSFAANGLGAMRTLLLSLTYGNDMPDAVFTTQSIYAAYEATLQPQTRFTNTKAADGGFLNLTFHEVPIFFDRDCTSGVMYFLNSNYLSFVVSNQADFTTSPFVEPENQDVRTAKILFQGNTTTSNRRMLGKLTDIT